MTQTPSKPPKITAVNPGNSNGSGSQKPQVNPRSVAQPVGAEIVKAMPKSKATFWQNLSFRGKLATMLIAGAAIPAIAVTQGMVAFSQQNAQKTLEETVKANGTGFQGDYVDWLTLESIGQVHTIADALEAAKINVQDADQIKANQALLQSLIAPPLVEEGRPDGWKSFRIITDAKGKTIAQYLKVHKNYPIGTSLEETGSAIAPFSLPPGIDLSQVPIVQAALKQKRALHGTELLDDAVVQKLGLGQQVTEADRKEGIDGLAGMAVEPIEIDGKLVGLAITGTVFNRGHILVDTFREYYSSEASIYAGDTLVATTIKNEDGSDRAIGRKASAKAVQTVLTEGQELASKEIINGTAYLTYYVPLYDYQKELNPKEAKPVGMISVGTPPETIESAVNSLQRVGYGIGGGILLLAGLLAFPVAGTFSRPLKRLQEFAGKVATGEVDARLEETDRRDEIGILSQELNQMASSIEISLAALRQEAAREQLLKDVTLQLSQFPQVADAFNNGLEQIRLRLKADRVVIYRFDEVTLEGVAMSESVRQGLPPAFGSTIANHELDEQYRQGQIQAISNIYQSSLSSHEIKTLQALGVKSNLVLPILRGSRGYLTGLLCVHQCSNSRTWQSNDIDLLKQVATQIGLTFDRANLLEKTKAASDRAQALKDITVKMAQATQAQSIFEVAVAEIRQVIQSDRVIVYRFDQNWKGTIIAESVANNFPIALGAEIADPCFADRYVDKYKQGRVQATKDIYQAGLTDCHLKQLEPFKVKANLVATILLEGELLGLLIAHQCSATRNWQPETIEFFTQIASQMGLALERANLLQQQQAEKELLQKRAMELLKEVDPLSRGDLTIRATVSEDEIGTVADSYNSTIESLRKIVAQVKEASKQMTVTTSNNEVSVKNLSQEANRQTEEITQVLNRIQTMTESIRAVSDNAKKAETVVKQATQTVQEGDRAMNQTVDGILAIRETVSETAEKVKRLGESSQKISKVVNLIGRFAAQTHLLALKASIEAARAGEEGQGFAVIADEVRALASQSAEATAEIDNLVSSIQSETSEAVAAMAVGTERVVVGTKLVEQTRQSLTKIAQASTQINQLVGAIAQAASAQSQASEAVTQTMGEVAGISSQTSTEATEVAASFKELLAVAQELQKSVGQFKVG